MLGRALFALVWLIIAAGVLLPLYPSDVSAPGSAGGEVAAVLAGVMDGGCGTCLPAAAGGAECARAAGGGIAAAPAALAACSRLTIHLVVQPESPERALEPAAPLPRLPEV